MLGPRYTRYICVSFACGVRMMPSSSAYKHAEAVWYVQSWDPGRLREEGAYLRSNSVNPNLVTHVDAENSEVVRGWHEPHVLVDGREHDRDRPRRDVVEGSARDRRYLENKKRHEGDEHGRHSGDDEEGLSFA